MDSVQSPSAESEYEGKAYVERLLSIVPLPERDEVIAILGRDLVEKNEVG
jgi:hypothetical protein